MEASRIVQLEPCAPVAGPEPPSVCFPSPTAVVPDDPAVTAAHTEADASVFVPSATRVG